MKNIFFGMLAAAGLLLAASCSEENLNDVQSGNEVTVSFTIGLDGVSETRAISDGKSADKLIYAVFDADGNRLSDVVQVVKENVAFPTTETIALAKDQTYKVVFWAQDTDCKAYSVSDAMTVTVDYTSTSDVTYCNNDETRDAFYAATDAFEVKGSKSMDVVLKRPFAQINVGVTEADWTAAEKLGIAISTSEVIIDNAATSIDLLTGNVAGSTTVTYAAAAIPSDPETLSVTVDGTTTPYKWLSMSYILVNETSDGGYGAAKTTLESLAYIFTPESGTAITFSDGLTSVPVQRNYRTNIIGQILTGNVSFNISINPIYDGDYIYPDTLEEQLKMAAAYGGTVTLTEDLALTEALAVAEEVSMTIDLNGHSLTYSGSSSDYILQVANKGSLTITGEGEVGSSDSTSDIYVSGTLTITDGTYYGTVTCAEGGSVSITGGTFYFDPASYVNTSEYQVSTSTDSSSNTCYTVEEKVATGIVDEATLKAAIANNAQITLGANIAMASGLDIPAYNYEACDYDPAVSNVTIDLNGYSLTSSSDYVIRLGTGSSLTITGDGTVGDSSSTNSIYNSGGDLTINGGTYAKQVRCLDGGSVTVKDGTFNGTFFAFGTATDITGGTFNSNLYIGDSSTATISGVTCNGTLTVEYGCSVSITNGSFIKVSNGGDLVINGGTVTGALSCGDGITTINGGSFESSVTCSDGITTINGGDFGGTMSFSGSAEITDGTFAGNFDCTSGALTISGGIYNGTLNCCDDAVIDISGGEFNGDLHCGYSTGGGTIKISNGIFKGVISDVSDGEYMPAGTITITGGTFYNEPSSSFIESGYSSTETQDDSGTNCYKVAKSS